MSIKEWVHIDYIGGDPWVKRIWAALNDKNFKIPEPLSQKGLAIAIRLDMLEPILRRICKTANDLYKSYLNEVDIKRFKSSKNKRGYAFPMNIYDKFGLIADIDALLFELNACCELIRKFTALIYPLIGKKFKQKDMGKEIRKILKSSKSNIEWFEDLDKHRNFLLHEGSAYIAIDVTNAPHNFDLIIMKENLKTFDDKNKFFTLNQLGGILAGFYDARQKIRDYLVKEIQKVA